MSSITPLSLPLKLCAAALILNSTYAWGATYYLATTGNDSNACATAQSSNTPKKTFSSAWGCLTPGDTLIVADGTYTSASPPSGKAGSAGSVITVLAASDGGAILSGGLTLKNNSYLAFEGFKIVSTGASLSAGSAGTGLVTHHVTFRRCGFTTTSTNEDGGVIIYDGTHHMLFEDFWAWGGGRYTFHVYGWTGGNNPNTTADYNTFRRGVIRQGPSDSSSGHPEASMVFYNSSYNIVENVIALDGQQNSDSSNTAFYLTSHAPPPPGSVGNKYYGVIALNNLGNGLHMDSNEGSSTANTEVRDSVFWGNRGGYGVLFYNTTKNCDNSVIDHVTVGGTINPITGIYNLSCNKVTITSSISMQSGVGIKNTGSIALADYNDVYSNNNGNYSGLSAGAHSYTTNPQLKYITRVEDGTVCKGGGAGGTNCGANVTKRYQDGILTSTDLWPWPYEARIKKEMCTDAGFTTGFCAKLSLTEYVWTYLGYSNPNPGIGTLSAPLNLTIKPDQ